MTPCADSGEYRWFTDADLAFDSSNMKLYFGYLNNENVKIIKWWDIFQFNYFDLASNKTETSSLAK